MTPSRHLWHSPFQNKRGGGVRSTLLLPKAENSSKAETHFKHCVSAYAPSRESILTLGAISSARTNRVVPVIGTFPIQHVVHRFLLSHINKWHCQSRQSKECTDIAFQSVVCSSPHFRRHSALILKAKYTNLEHFDLLYKLAVVIGSDLNHYNCIIFSRKFSTVHVFISGHGIPHRFQGFTNAEINFMMWSEMASDHFQ